jgi:hypothetical protein
MRAIGAGLGFSTALLRWSHGPEIVGSMLGFCRRRKFQDEQKAFVGKIS